MNTEYTVMRYMGVFDTLYENKKVGHESWEQYTKILAMAGGREPCSGHRREATLSRLGKNWKMNLYALAIGNGSMKMHTNLIKGAPHRPLNFIKKIKGFRPLKFGIS